MILWILSTPNFMIVIMYSFYVVPIPRKGNFVVPYRAGLPITARKGCIKGVCDEIVCDEIGISRISPGVLQELVRENFAEAFGIFLRRRFS